MHREHKKLLQMIKAVGDPPSRRPTGENDSYGSSGHVFYRVSVPERRKLAKAWLAAHKALPAEEFLAVVESLFAGSSHEEKTLAALLLAYHGPGRRAARPLDVDRWLTHLNGWAEIDSLCQNVFSAEELLGSWRAWQGLIKRLARASNVNRRRASIVLLTGPVRYSSDARFRDLAIETIDSLKSERDIMITKAISWLLRSMIAQHRATVARYLEANAATLPKIAVRETRTKMTTGTKTRRA